MIFAVHSDVGYLNERKSRNCTGGHFYLSSNEKYPTNNGAILNIAKIINDVMSSAVEAKPGALYINSWEAVYLHHIRTKLGQPQPKMPFQTDISTAKGVLNSMIQQK